MITEPTGGSGGYDLSGDEEDEQEVTDVEKGLNKKNGFPIKHAASFIKREDSMRYRKKSEKRN